MPGWSGHDSSSTLDMAPFYPRMRSSQQAIAVAAAALSESTPAAIGIRTAVASERSGSDSPERSEPISTAARTPGSTVSSGAASASGVIAKRFTSVSDAMSSNSVGGAGVGERERSAHGDAQRSPSERVGAGVVEDQTVPAEPRGVADDGADVCRVVDGLEHDETSATSGELGDARASGPMEERDHRLGHAEPGHDAADFVATRIDRCAGDADASCDVRDAPRVDQRRDRDATGVECPFDDQVALGEKQPGARVVALVGPTRQPAFVQPELGESVVVGIVDDDDVRVMPRSRVDQKWYGNGDQSASRFSRKLSRPSAASSVP